ncbi:MAG: glycosyltransferase family 4 protein [Pirellulales bacterium]
MKIVYITAGAAGMFCGSCLHDNRLAAALLAIGEDVVLVPTYTPIRTDETDVSYRGIFLGGINVFLQQKSAIFRHVPAWFSRLLDRPQLVDWLARRAAATHPARLGDLTVSMLEGIDGRQRREFHRLVRWIAEEMRPDVVHLSNTLLTGLVRPLREVLDVPLVGSVSGEDSFVEKLPEPNRRAARDKLAKNCRPFDALVAMNVYYADFMSDYLSMPRSRIHVIRHGLRLDGYGDRSSKTVRGGSRTIGYLARICPDKGLHLLVDAYVRLLRDPEMHDVELRVAGYVGRGEREYLETQLRKLRTAGRDGACHYVGEVTREEKRAFLESLDLFCLPTAYRESKGIPAIEALASGVPIVVPAHGCFPELVEATGGGLLFEPFDIEGLVDRLRRLLRQDELARQLGRQGRQAVQAIYHDRRMADETRQLYRKLIDAR